MATVKRLFKPESRNENGRLTTKFALQPNPLQNEHGNLHQPKMHPHKRRWDLENKIQ
jgi:hypothetical protein